MKPKPPRVDTRIFTLDRTTTGTYRYRAVTEGFQPAPVAYIYIERWFFGLEPPPEIEVTVRERERSLSSAEGRPRQEKGEGLEPEEF